MPAVLGLRGLFYSGRYWVFVCSLAAALQVQADPVHQFLDNFDGISLIDQRGREFDAESLSGRVVLFNFIFTGCDSTCPLQTQTLAQVLTALPEKVRSQVRFISVSIDPGNDTPEKLQRFAQRMQADLDGWLFLTGNVLQLQDVARRLHLLDENKPDNPKIHRTSLWLVDSQGRMLQRYKGNPPDRDRLIRELIQVSRMLAAAN